MGNFIDLTGQKFGKLTVVKRVDDYIYTSNGKIDYKSLSKMYAASK